MSDELTPGRKAPDFSLPSDTGETLSLKSFKGKQVVLYFYPKDDTPGCTKEACDFRDAMASLLKTDAVVLGVSLDGEESHRKFRAKHHLPFSLLSDRDTSVSRTYGVYKEKNLYGKKHWGIERSTFVIDRAGVMKGMFRNVKVDAHVADVLAVLKKK